MKKNIKKYVISILFVSFVLTLLGCTDSNKETVSREDTLPTTTIQEEETKVEETIEPIEEEYAEEDVIQNYLEEKLVSELGTGNTATLICNYNMLNEEYDIDPLYLLVLCESYEKVNGKTKKFKTINVPVKLNTDPMTHRLPKKGSGYIESIKINFTQKYFTLFKEQENNKGISDLKEKNKKRAYKLLK